MISGNKALYISMLAFMLGLVIGAGSVQNRETSKDEKFRKCLERVKFAKVDRPGVLRAQCISNEITNRLYPCSPYRTSCPSGFQQDGLLSRAVPTIYNRAISWAIRKDSESRAIYQEASGTGRRDIC